MKLQSMQSDWFSKSLAGLLLGFVIAIACSGLFMCLPLVFAPVFKVQLAMWMVAPVWLSILALCFLFQSGKRAWIHLGIISVIAIVILMLVKSIA